MDGLANEEVICVFLLLLLFDDRAGNVHFHYVSHSSGSRTSVIYPKLLNRPENFLLQLAIGFDEKRNFQSIRRQMVSRVADRVPPKSAFYSLSQAIRALKIQ